jgi:hypothetical protein
MQCPAEVQVELAVSCNRGSKWKHGQMGCTAAGGPSAAISGSVPVPLQLAAKYSTSHHTGTCSVSPPPGCDLARFGSEKEPATAALLVPVRPVW